MALLAEKPIEEIGFTEIAAQAGVSLSDLRDTFGSTVAILAAQVEGDGSRRAGRSGRRACRTSRRASACSTC